MMDKRFGVIGYFASEMHIRVRHTDKELASQVVRYCLNNGIKHSIQFCRNGNEIIEIIGNEVVLRQLKRLTIKKQIGRLEDKLSLL